VAGARRLAPRRPDALRSQRDGQSFGRFASPLLGAHNVRNALAAVAVGARAGLTAGAMADGLRAFKGIKRRLEIVGRAARRDGLRRLRATIPTAVHETLAALKTGYPGRKVWAVFEPRSRRRAARCSRTTSRAPSAPPTKW
jgi:UDP-N-acetylmuramate: L-alanyl-gamma-D-glutamyl-meso-diaminopimelate ligase